MAVARGPRLVKLNIVPLVIIEKFIDRLIVSFNPPHFLSMQLTWLMFVVKKGPGRMGKQTVRNLSRDTNLKLIYILYSNQYNNGSRKRLY